MKLRDNLVFRAFLVFTLTVLAVLAGFVLAQVEINPVDPGTWFVSEETIFAAGTLIAGWLVLLFTALGKDWFQTDGISTVILSGILSVLIAGIGGYYALGFLAGAGGFAGALKAMAMALLSFVGSNAKAKYDRQAAAAAAERIERAKTRLL